MNLDIFYFVKDTFCDINCVAIFVVSFSKDKIDFQKKNHPIGKEKKVIFDSQLRSTTEMVEWFYVGKIMDKFDQMYFFLSRPI